MSIEELRNKSKYRRFAIVNEILNLFRTKNLLIDNINFDSDDEIDTEDNDWIEEVIKKSNKYHTPEIRYHMDADVNDYNYATEMIAYLLATTLVRLNKDNNKILEYFKKNSISHIFGGKTNDLKLSRSDLKSITEKDKYMDINLYIIPVIHETSDPILLEKITKNNISKIINSLKSKFTQNTKENRQKFKNILMHVIEFNEYIQSILLPIRYYFEINGYVDYRVISEPRLYATFTIRFKKIFILLTGHNQPKSLIWMLKSYSLFDANIFRLTCNLAG